MSTREQPAPDPKVVEYLCDDVARGWADVFSHHPESDLDVTLMDCSILRGRRSPPHPISEEILQIFEVSVNGEQRSSDLWSTIRSCAREDSVESLATMDSIQCRLLCYGGMFHGLFNTVCVYKGGTGQPFEPGDDVFRNRILHWCDAAVALGAALAAARVEVAGREDATPIVLWRG